MASPIEIEEHLGRTSLALNAGLICGGAGRTFLGICYDCWEQKFGGSVPAFTVLADWAGRCQFCGRTIPALPLDESLWPEMVRLPG